jgi:hypothetical protein
MVMCIQDSVFCRGGECNIPIFKPKTSDVYCEGSMNSPCGQVKPPLDQDPFFDPRQKGNKW